MSVWRLAPFAAYLALAGSCRSGETGLPVPSDGGGGGRSDGSVDVVQAGDSQARRDVGADFAGAGADASRAEAIAGPDSGYLAPEVPGDASADARWAADASMPIPPPDASPSLPSTPSPGRIDCGSMSCDLGTQLCCAREVAGSESDSCEPDGAACDGAIRLCDAKEDCPAGQYCCQRPAAGSPLPERACADGCKGGAEGFPVCHSAADCPPGQSCCPVSPTVLGCGALSC